MESSTHFFIPLLHPPLTTVRQNRDELGKSAFYALASQMGQTRIGTLLLHPELVERSSSGPAPLQK